MGIIHIKETSEKYRSTSKRKYFSSSFKNIGGIDVLTIYKQ